MTHVLPLGLTSRVVRGGNHSFAINSAGNASAENITDVDVRGIDCSYSMQLELGPLAFLRIGLMYQDVRASARTTTAYVADNLRTQVILETRWILPLDIRAAYVARVVERVIKPIDFVVHDMRLMRTFGSVTITAEATNLTNQRFIETGWVVVPPRWARLGAAVML